MTPTPGPKYIYGLADPEPQGGAVRYVGASKHPEIRYAQLLSGSGPQPHDFYTWLGGLREFDLLPDLRILHPLADSWRQIEKEFQLKHGATLLDKSGRLAYLRQTPMREILGDNLRAAREAKGMTREQAAAALVTTPTTVYRWENGDRIPDLHRLSTASRVYGVAPWLLLPSDPEEESYAQDDGISARADAAKARQRRK